MKTLRTISSHIYDYASDIRDISGRLDRVDGKWTWRMREEQIKRGRLFVSPHSESHQGAIISLRMLDRDQALLLRKH